jgi:hypothetical protein
MPTKLTRLKCYAFLKEVYGDKPQPDFKKYEIEDLRKATRIWYEWNDENGWVLKNNNTLEHANQSTQNAE